MRRYGFVIFLLSLGASAQEVTGGPGNPAGTPPSEAAADAATLPSAESPEAATPQPAPGYIITPWGSLIFPDAPPLAGDTSTLAFVDNNDNPAASTIAEKRVRPVRSDDASFAALHPSADHADGADGCLQSASFGGPATMPVVVIELGSFASE